ncbi:MAG: MotA/TolQ/ExbB proton channel family protein [Alphaproteobacteria bacterium]|nr:MotA/TolQ/ExbB proton channel family protein [Alphaproteobacteria bacterium]
MIQFLKDGGVIMIPIGVASVVGLASFFERLWALRREKVVPRAFCVELVELLRQQRWADALMHCKKRDVPIARVVEVAIEARGESRSSLRERVEEVGRREAMELERWIWVLATVASVGPLLGLLGTVSGMITTFQTVEGGGIGQMQSLAGGIGMALITTFAGLVVAIPAVVAHRFLLARVDDLTVDLEEISLGAVNLISAASHEAPEPTAAAAGGAPS